MTVTYLMHGQPVQRRTFRYALNDPFKRMLFDILDDMLHSGVPEIRCHIHHEAPEITLTTDHGEKIKYTVTGCCDAVINAVMQAIAEEQQAWQ